MVTVDRVRMLLEYEPSCGVLRWIIGQGRSAPGSVAGTIKPNGYRVVTIDGGKHYAHRLIWFYVHGVWPAVEIDHINGQKDDNRIGNLREATGTQNQGNRGSTNPNGKGVTYHKRDKRWQAQMSRYGKHVHLGQFKNKDDARAAYAKAAVAHFGEFARLGNTHKE